MSTYSLEVKRIFSVSAEAVYDAWLDPNAIREFMRPGDIVRIPTPQVDARVGGAFLFDMHVGENIMPHKGEYRILDRPRKIQFTWNSMNTNNTDSIVTISINSLNESSCELTLVHKLLPSEASREDHNSGWNNILKTLDKISG